MWYVILWNIVKWIFAYLPIEQILARAFNHALQKIDESTDIAKITKTVEHCSESIGLMMDIISDSVVTPDEVNILNTELNKLRHTILNKWANGESAKDVEQELINRTVSTE